LVCMPILPERPFRLDAFIEEFRNFSCSFGREMYMVGAGKGRTLFDPGSHRT